MAYLPGFSHDIFISYAHVDHRCPLKTLAVCFVPPRRKEDGVRFDLSFAKVHHFNFDELKQPQTLAILLDEN